MKATDSSFSRTKGTLAIAISLQKCCTEVCPEDIHITDNAIIPLKERVVDEFYDPLGKFIKGVMGGGKK